jgi:hypothetical protein
MNALIFFCKGRPFVLIKLEDNKTVSGVSQTQQYIVLLYLDDDMLRSLDRHQAIFTKLRISYIQAHCMCLILSFVKMA